MALEDQEPDVVGSVFVGSVLVGEAPEMNRRRYCPPIETASGPFAA